MIMTCLCPLDIIHNIVSIGNRLSEFQNRGKCMIGVFNDEELGIVIISEGFYFLSNLSMKTLALHISPIR